MALSIIIMVSEKSDPLAEEKLGYFGELVVLEATANDLGTCWMGMYDAGKAPISLKQGEEAVIAVAIGYTAEPKATERLIRSVVRRKSKSVEELIASAKEPPEWFIKGVEAVKLAPSAVNRQPDSFSFDGKTAFASVKNIAENSMAIDLGIAKAHFALAAGGEWEWGNGAAFHKN